MSETAKDILRRIESWPPEDQDELVEVAHEIEARRSHNHRLTPGEATAVERGLREMRERKFATDHDIASILRKARSSGA
jgi:hypothetical protein